MIDLLSASQPGAAPCVPVYKACKDWLAVMKSRLRLGPPKHRLPQTSGKRIRPINWLHYVGNQLCKVARSRRNAGSTQRCRLMRLVIFS
jgi:hypothetical protein